MSHAFRTALTARRARALLALAGLAATPLLLAGGGGSPSASAEPVCPPGTTVATRSPGQSAHDTRTADPSYRDLLGAVNAAADRYCRPVKSPERYAEVKALADQQAVLSAGPQGFSPPGGLRAALAQQQAMQQAAATVPGAAGTFAKVGTTPLITDDPKAPEVNGLGLADQAGRVDSYVYDPLHKRLFSAPGTGGVWLSTDTGASWRSIGDSLPYQSVGAVTWSRDGSAANGTLLVVSGEASGGGSVYVGLGAFYSTDLGATWVQSKGIPDGLMGFEIEVDPSNPKVVYAATSQGLFRSTDTGRTYRNVNLPTGACAGKTGYGNICHNGNWVTDVEIQTPGGTTGAKGGRVLAVVGYRAGRLPYPGTDTPQSPANGIYRSETGAPGTFTMLDVSGDGQTPVGFAPQERIGRTEFGAAIGASQNHDFVYAIVEDAVLFNGGVPGLDLADETSVTGGVPNNTALNGIYVSQDWGSSWTRMADELELQSPITESALIGASQASLYAPGVQAWYNQWIAPDPTRQTEAGIPTRLVFGLEELWESRVPNTPQDGQTQSVEPASFRVIGPYFSGDTCGFLANPLPVCVTQQTQSGDKTTHPDQQSGIWIPGADGSVTLVVGNDGGTYRQTVARGAELTKQWGRGSQKGYNTLLPYDASAAKDGTVVFGLQDNGSGHITPQGKILGTYGGDGFYAAVDPDDSNTYYNEVTLATMQVTRNGGQSYTDISPPVTNPQFSNAFVMDPTDANHLLTGGPEIVERTTGPSGSWKQVFNLDDTAGDPHQMTAVELQGDAAYVGWCQICDIINKTPSQVFASGIATNVGGDAEPAAGSTAGWHMAAAKGLPDRYISSIAVDPKNPKRVVVVLAGYANRQWWPAGSFNDKNPNRGEGHVFVSTDAGETFTDISGAVPDVPARSVEIRGSQILVGTDIGVFLSSDLKGSTWAALKGLPKAPVVSVKNWPGKPNQVVLATFGRGVYSYTFSNAAPPPAVTPPVVTPKPRTPLPATGLPVALGTLGLALLGGGLLLRRRGQRRPV